MLKKTFDTIKNNFKVEWIIYFFLAFVAFNFANSLIAFVCISLLGNIILLVKKKKYSDVGLLTLAMSVFPLLAFLVFLVTSNFNLDPSSNLGIANLVFLFIGCISIPFLGYQVRISDKINIKNIIKTIYIALAVYMLINLLITLINYGPFYTFIYKDRFFFDYGHLSRLSIDKSAYMLLGFKVTITTIEFFSIFASILSSAILGLFFVSYKEDKRSFLVYLICGCIGLLCILATLNKGLLISYAALVVGFAITVLFAKKIIPFNKTTKIIIYSLLGLAGFIYIIFMLCALNVQPIANCIENNAFLNRLFINNKILRKYHNFIRAMSDCNGYRGFTGYLIGRDAITFTGSWFFDLFALSQIFGWAVFVIFVVVMFVRFANFFKTSNKDFASKMLLFGIALAFFVFTIAGYNSQPFFENTLYVPFMFVSPFLIVLFIFGYVGENAEENIE